MSKTAPNDLVKVRFSRLLRVDRNTYRYAGFPSEDDVACSLACRSYMNVGPADRSWFRRKLDKRKVEVLAAYVARTPTLALLEKSRGPLLEGLVALAIGEDPVRDFRDVLVVVAPHHICARRLGIDPGELFDEAASFGCDELGDIYREFGPRDDITARSFAVKEDKGPHGEAIFWRWWEWPGGWEPITDEDNPDL